MTRTIIATAIALALSGATAYAGSDAYPDPVARSDANQPVIPIEASR
jgi:hypothetical protein